MRSLRTLWKWANKREYVDSFVVERCESPHRPKLRDRVYSGKELAALWKAASTLSAAERDYVWLLILLVPRKKALARMERGLNEDVSMWVTPFELTKSRAMSRHRTYRTPLPALSRSIIMRRLRETNGNYLFGSDGEAPLWPGSKLVRKLVAAGAPKDFTPHSLRHTCTSWFEDQGHSLFERGVILNHAQQGVTAGYSHGFAKDFKTQLQEKWQDRIVEVTGAEIPGALGDEASRWASVEMGLHQAAAVLV